MRKIKIGKAAVEEKLRNFKTIAKPLEKLVAIG